MRWQWNGYVISTCTPLTCKYFPLCHSALLTGCPPCSSCGCTYSVEPGEWRQLILDGHGSHKTPPDFLDFCIQRKIIPFLTIPHSTHLVQPLDYSIFGPFQKAYSDELDESLRKNEPISKATFLQ